MTTRRTITEPVEKVLAYLLELTVQRAGFTVLETPGWASAERIEAGVKTWGTAELMRTVARRGLVDQYDARAPGEPKPQWLYRIAQRGADDLAAALGVTPDTVEAPRQGEESCVLLRETVQHAVSGLRSALDPTASARREWVAGDVGWRSSRELTGAMAREDDACGATSYRWFTTDDLQWLVRLGFAEERVIGRTHVYRLTHAGALLIPLQWKTPKHVPDGTGAASPSAPRPGE